MCVTCVKWGLEWGSTRFTLLGINFSVNFNEIENLNYDPRMKEIENIVKTWTNQLLSQIGKNNSDNNTYIIKIEPTIHVLPSPSSTKLNHFTEKKNFSSSWITNHIKLVDILSIPHCLGGLKMINIENYIKGLKVNLIRKINRNKNL